MAVVLQQHLNNRGERRVVAEDDSKLLLIFENRDNKGGGTGDELRRDGVKGRFTKRNIPMRHGETLGYSAESFAPITSGRVVIAQAQSTGKTSMISLALCQIVDTTSTEVQALILSPTRELAAQTEKFILAVGDFINIKAHACIGGKSIGEDIRKLEHGVHIVSGTPGRVSDMIKRRTLRTRCIKILVLDESDEMLSRGFKDQIYDVYRYLPPELQESPLDILLNAISIIN